MKTNLTSKLYAVLVTLAFALPGIPKGSIAAIHLDPHNGNGRYFTDENGKAVYLTGSHTWNNFLDGGWEALNFSNPYNFDFDAYLNWMANDVVGLGHNFIRLWTPENVSDFQYNVNTHQWELEGNRGNPTLYVRDTDTGTNGTANDGLGKFKLDELNEFYFCRLRARVIAARAKHVYVSIMLFNGWGVGVYNWAAGGSALPWWLGHPYNKNNHLGTVDGGDSTGTGDGLKCHTEDADVWTYQEAYVRKVIDKVKDLDNVLFEISNESAGQNTGNNSTDWQYDMIELIHCAEEDLVKENSAYYQHPVGMTYQYESFTGNDPLWNSEADWIGIGSPYQEGDIPAPPLPSNELNPAKTLGDKVVILDTDHLRNNSGNTHPADRRWVWKCFTRGYNPIYMDQLDSAVDPTSDAPINGASSGTPLPATAHEVRDAMGDTRYFADKMNLVDMIPQGIDEEDPSSTGYCVFKVGEEYLVYQPVHGEWFTVFLPAGTYNLEWFDPETGDPLDEGPSEFLTDDLQGFTPPSAFGDDAILFITAYERPKTDHRPRS